MNFLDKSNGIFLTIFGCHFISASSRRLPFITTLDKFGSKPTTFWGPSGFQRMEVGKKRNRNGWKNIG